MVVMAGLARYIPARLVPLWLVLLGACTQVVVDALTWNLPRPHSLHIVRHQLAMASDPGHVFVVRGDLRQLAVDAVLMPTPSVLNCKWFPNGPPPGAIATPREHFTAEQRVHLLRGTLATEPQLWLSVVDGRFAAREAIEPATGRPGLDWYIVAAEQYLRKAGTHLLAGGAGAALDDGANASRGAGTSWLAAAAAPPRFGRHRHLIALPVLGTGRGGARTASGLMIAQLLSLLQRFAEEQPLIDVALVVKSKHMFSAAQAYRSQRVDLSPRWSALLGPRLCKASVRLAALAKSEQLALFLGAGVSVSAGLPAWQQLVTALAERDDVPMNPEEVRQLSKLEMSDQASVLASRLEREERRRRLAMVTCARGAHPRQTVPTLAWQLQRKHAEWALLQAKETLQMQPRYVEPRDEGLCQLLCSEEGEEIVGCMTPSFLKQLPPDLTVECPPPRSEAELVYERGAEREGLLQRLVVSELGTKREHALSHALLAGLPVSAVVTTNYDQLFESAWRAAKADFNVLPYETQPAEKYILKLHGDLRRAKDIVLTRGQMRDLLKQRKALTGILQTMLVTKHLLFVGFSLKDPNFGEVAGTVRSALRGQGSVSDAAASAAAHGADGSAASERSAVGQGTTAGQGTIAVHGNAVRHRTDVTAMQFGTMLSLHNRPFLSELWPDIRCTPMDLTDATRCDALSSAEASRLLDIFLDKLSLDASSTNSHLLDSDFGGVFKPNEQSLRETLIEFERRLQRNLRACNSRGYVVVEETLQKLGLSVKRDARTVFALFSADRLDNTIDSMELQRLFEQAGLAMDMAETRAMLQRHDQDADGRLSLNEFARLWERLESDQQHVLVAVTRARGE